MVHEQTYLHALCDTEVEKAFREFETEVKSAPYTCTSRKHPLWREVRLKIDPALSSFEKRTSINVLDGKNFSDIAKKNLREIENKLRCKIRLYQDQDNYAVVWTLEAILEVIFLCKNRMAQRQWDCRYEFLRGYVVSNFCDLCWRQVEVGNKYCTEHNANKAKYFTDKNHKKEFQAKVKEIIIKRNMLWFYKEVTRCDNWYQEIRWVAYQLTHSSRKKNKLKAYYLHKIGIKKQVDIARLLNIEPATVNEFFNKGKLGLFEKPIDLPQIINDPIASISFKDRCFYHLLYMVEVESKVRAVQMMREGLDQKNIADQLGVCQYTVSQLLKYPLTSIDDDSAVF